MSIPVRYYKYQMANIPPPPPPPWQATSYKAMSDTDEWKKLESRIERLEKKLDNFIRELLKQKNAK